MRSIFVIVDKAGNKTVVKESTVFLVRESTFVEADYNDEPIEDIPFCKEYSLDTLLFLGYMASEEHIFDGDFN